MKKLLLAILVFVAFSCKTGSNDVNEQRPQKVFLIGDSTVADYTLEADYQTRRYPIAGWGQEFQPFMHKDSLALLAGLIQADSVIVDDRAKGGRSTRTFFQEGRWRTVYDEMQPGDLVLMQFGHNDAAENKPERYVNLEGYKEFLRLFVSQTREKGGIPILLTPVNRNYPWENGVLTNVHGEYPQAVKDIAAEMDVLLIDLTQASCKHFTRMGKEYVTEKYFMNLPAGIYEAYHDGQTDNTHFQPEGATAVAQLVFNGLKALNKPNKMN
ncbi:rhamnogalacturonan acetylesterase [Gaoshiqia sediminis]|uniref:Rhamnogalacturonan acetylesterase n=1 Tax=Gaoshiqia sediminis TaxID=2986998 RepID=A0AA42C570_9BACT|nr:rhamnogalacturonan acetylesterase [Gaoshiqia sediminis]MCW0481249.1 rhamnogalacturonan acetylesterase [Gaoshiqia sediminis]